MPDWARSLSRAMAWRAGGWGEGWGVGGVGGRAASMQWRVSSTRAGSRWQAAGRAAGSRRQQPRPRPPTCSRICSSRPEGVDCAAMVRSAASSGRCWGSVGAQRMSLPAEGTAASSGGHPQQQHFNSTTAAGQRPAMLLPAARTRLHRGHQGRVPGGGLPEVGQALVAQQRQVGGGGRGRGGGGRQAVPAAQRRGGDRALERGQAAYAPETGSGGFM